MDNRLLLRVANNCDEAAMEMEYNHRNAMH